MTKPEILDVVKQMHKDWSFAKRFSFLSTLRQRAIAKICFSGFCFYIKCELKLYDNDQLFWVLFKDKAFEECGSYWYDTFEHKNSNSKNRLILQTRIDHLQRTITRLENEIKNEN